MTFVSTPSTSNNDDVSTVFGVSTDSLSDATVYAFLANQPNRFQLMHEDLEQIHEDDPEEMDLKMQLELLSMRAKKFFQKTGKKITINGSDTAGYDKAKVECFNKPTRRTMNVEDTSSKAMVAIDGAGFYWSYMADDEAPINMAFIAFSNSELIRSQITDKSKGGLGNVSYNVVPPPHTGRFLPLRIDLSHTGLPKFAKPSVKSYEVKPIKVVTQTFSVKISRPVKENYDAPLIKDWESKRDDEVKSSPEIERKTVEPSVDKVEVDIPKQNDKPARRPIKYVEMYKTQRPRGNQIHWNNLKSHQLGSNFVMCNKACYAYGSFNHLQARCKYHQRERMGHSHKQLEDQGYFNSRYSKHMIGNISYHTDFKEFDEEYVAFGKGAKGGKITCKGIIITADESHVLLKVPRKNNMYSVDMKNIVPKKDLTCLVVNATNDESMLWHRRLVTNVNKETRSKQNQTNPSTKRKA
nr:ribonuclease H-like domain-containing protein [Tanacetum cinerariifolium]